jgi:hypothetical protein
MIDTVHDPASSTRPATSAAPCCLHCSEPLMLDDLWGWVHSGGRYLCRDSSTGEPLCQPATLM